MSATGGGAGGEPLSLGSTMAATIVAGLQTAADDHSGEADRLRALCRAGNPLPLVSLLWPGVVFHGLAGAAMAWVILTSPAKPS